MIDLARPGHIGHVNHAVDTFFDFDESAVGGEVAHLALDQRADRVLERGDFPRVFLGLAHAERDFLLFHVDGENHRFDFFADFDHVRRALNALRPGNFGNVNQTFDTFFDFDEGTVRSQTDDFTADAGADRVLGVDILPRIGKRLLQAERNAFFLEVDIENHHFDLIADFDHFGRMVDATPTHVGDMQQAVDTVEVHERTEIGDVLDRALAELTDLDFAEQFEFLSAAGFFDDLAAGNHDVLALFVDFKNFDLQGAADVVVEVAHRNDIHLRAGKEGIRADIDDETALDGASDHPFNQAAFFAVVDDMIPLALLFSALLAEDDHAVVVFEAFEKNFNRVADLNGGYVFELVAVEESF